MCGMVSACRLQRGQTEDCWKRKCEIHALVQDLRRELMSGGGGRLGRLLLMMRRVLRVARVELCGVHLLSLRVRVRLA